MAESSPAASTPGAPAADNPLAAFGANEWLVDEMYERYKQDPNSVDKAWWDFFRNYQAEHGTEATPNGTTAKAAPDQARAKAPEKAPEPAPAPAAPAAAPAAEAPKDAAAAPAAAPAAEAPKDAAAAPAAAPAAEAPKDAAAAPAPKQ